MKSKPTRPAILTADDDPDERILASKARNESGLREIKVDPDLRRVPVIVLTPSSAEEVYRTYDLGGGFICYQACELR